MRPDPTNALAEAMIAGLRALQGLRVGQSGLASTLNQHRRLQTRHQERGHVHPPQCRLADDNRAACMGPHVLAGERPLLAFVGSVMRPELQWARDATVEALT
jgi:hypothetical protein